MENSVRTFQYRSSEYLSHRNVDICRTVLKICLCRRILRLKQFYCELCPVRAAPADFYAGRCIQNVDHFSLHPLIERAVKRIDPDHCVKDLCVFFFVFCNCRKREVNDRETSVPGDYGFAVQIRRLDRVFRAELLLYFIIARGGRRRSRAERPVPESFYNCGTGVENCAVSQALVSIRETFQFSRAERFIQKECFILAMIVIILGIRVGAAVPHFTLVKGMEQSRNFSGEDRSEAV